ncbi:hypothetical protein E3N88_45311 [Mikania micrantha]|uniref:Uncharacterized protein n=1 Tax=Mikania micrantha TaxID=192012 RepID=A0A5N6L9M1_9ASTR|nr:hypothetical protein E3N88_45311 [Mikania micrantha]
MDLLQGFSGSYVIDVNPTIVVKYNYLEVGVHVLNQQANDRCKIDGFEHLEVHMTKESEFIPSNDESEGENPVPLLSKQYNLGVLKDSLKDLILMMILKTQPIMFFSILMMKITWMHVTKIPPIQVRLGMYFNSKNDVMYAVRRWNVACNTEIYVAHRKPSLWKTQLHSHKRI